MKIVICFRNDITTFIPLNNSCPSFEIANGFLTGTRRFDKFKPLPLSINLCYQTTRIIIFVLKPKAAQTIYVLEKSVSGIVRESGFIPLSINCFLQIAERIIQILPDMAVRIGDPGNAPLSVPCECHTKTGRMCNSIAVDSNFISVGITDRKKILSLMDVIRPATGSCKTEGCGIKDVQ